MARRAIGVDVGATGVRAAQVDLSQNPPVLERFGQVALPPGAVRDGEIVDADAVASALKELWAAVRFASKDVFVGVANQRVVVRQVDLLWMPEKELRKSLPLLVQDMIPLPVDQAVLDFVPLAEITGDDGSRMLRGLLVAAVEDMVSALADALVKAGLRPRVIDLTPFALVSATSRGTGLGTVPRPEAVVDIGSEITNIVVHEGGIPRFVRILVMGGDSVTTQLATSLSVQTAEAEAVKRRVGLLGRTSTDPEVVSAGTKIAAAAGVLVDEIRGSLDYYVATTGSQALNRVRLTGGGAQLPGFREALSVAVRTPVEFGTPFQTVAVGDTGLTTDQLQIVEPTASVAVGLALGGAA